MDAVHIRGGGGSGSGASAGRTDKASSRRAGLIGTAVVLVIGWVAAAGNTGIAYATLGTDWIPVATGCVGGFVFVIALHLLHEVLWTLLLAAAAGVLVLVGSVQYAPEAALERRGIREQVTIVEHKAISRSSHEFTLRGPDGRLDETLTYDGASPGHEVGDRLEILRDPERVVPLEPAADVDASGQLGSLITGVGVWTALTLIAGRRAHVRRRRAAALAGGALVG
ncbi:hypothetical protein [Streptomyces sp. NPDC059009]|uniref:hypothetical protein n=1 Tax=Streptomyces sp. NPDC059009 TaxID=3346694 RepID=UPI0036842E6E